MSVLVLEPEVRVLLRRKLEKLESVLYHDKRVVFLLFSSPARPVRVFLTAPCSRLSLFSRFPSPSLHLVLFSLPRPCHAEPICLSPRLSLAKLNHFHREYIRHVQNLPDDRERLSYIYVIHTAHQRA